VKIILIKIFKSKIITADDKGNVRIYDIDSGKLENEFNYMRGKIEQILIWNSGILYTIREVTFYVRIDMEHPISDRAVLKGKVSFSTKNPRTFNDMHELFESVYLDEDDDYYEMQEENTGKILAYIDSRPVVIIGLDGYFFFKDVLSDYVSVVTTNVYFDCSSCRLSGTLDDGKYLVIDDMYVITRNSNEDNNIVASVDIANDNDNDDVLRNEQYFIDTYGDENFNLHKEWYFENDEVVICEVLHDKKLSTEEEAIYDHMIVDDNEIESEEPLSGFRYLLIYRINQVDELHLEFWPDQIQSTVPDDNIVNSFIFKNKESKLITANLKYFAALNYDNTIKVYDVHSLRKISEFELSTNLVDNDDDYDEFGRQM
jgi:WD40 repeat protein